MYRSVLTFRLYTYTYSILLVVYCGCQFYSSNYLVLMESCNLGLFICKNQTLLYRTIYQKWQHIDTPKSCIIVPLVAANFVHAMLAIRLSSSGANLAWLQSSFSELQQCLEYFKLGFLEIQNVTIRSVFLRSTTKLWHCCPGRLSD